MRRALTIVIVCGCGCTTDNPAFDPKDRNDTASADATAGPTTADESGDDVADTGLDACEPPEPQPIVTFDADLPQCDGGSSASFAGMVVGQSGSAVSVAPCPEGCPCEPQEGWIGFVLHPTIALPVFPDCIAVEVALGGEACQPVVLGIWGLEGDQRRLLVHAEHLQPDSNAVGIEVTPELATACECEICEADTRPAGAYGLTFTSSIDEVGPLATGQIAEMMIAEETGPTRFVVAALATSLDCDCSARGDLQWSVTRG